jgi:methylthioribulose-1-phosphate dehydratase
MLRLFYDKGWVSGTGGGICGLESHGRLLVAPTGVHKERVQPQDLFVVRPETGDVIERPADTSSRPSECLNVFREVIARRGAGAVVHTHSLEAVLAGDVGQEALAIERFEMLKGIRGVSYADEHLVPVIDNTAHESELVDQVRDVLSNEWFDATFAILVRDHGAYIWGEDVWEAKRHAEVYHWLFDAVALRGG